VPIEPDEPAMATLTVMEQVSQARPACADRRADHAATGRPLPGRYLTQGSITRAA
jgi:hypothetical protein